MSNRRVSKGSAIRAAIIVLGAFCTFPLSASAATISETINGTAFLSNGKAAITGTFLYDTVAGNAIDWSIKIPKDETDLFSSYILNPANSVTYGDFGPTGDYEQVFDNSKVSLYFDTLTPMPTVPNTFVELDADILCGTSPCNRASDLNYPGQVFDPRAVVIVSGRITATPVPVPSTFLGSVFGLAGMMVIRRKLNLTQKAADRKIQPVGSCVS